MENVKQVIVMRKDLNMRKGKLIAQGSHASLGALLESFNKYEYTPGSNNLIRMNCYEVRFEKDGVLDKWLNGIFTKICLYVESEQELIDLYNKICSTNSEIPCVMIEDSGLTEFHGVKTKTCIGIGPWWGEEIDEFTKELKLL